MKEKMMKPVLAAMTTVMMIPGVAMAAGTAPTTANAGFPPVSAAFMIFGFSLVGIVWAGMAAREN
ncbi:hypothetical protein [Heliophilum fasciatum]|uniref:hypothetical protein n=1 Tax=Heliophilum fasciatum TaxID=35700 RepID=UPI0010529B08|nr:hypothetical protein [Heliophilum fasciatum]MCW2277611.1 hypothetical protein [Heliophilum fasciatum]